MYFLHQLRCVLGPDELIFVDVTASTHWASETVEVQGPRVKILYSLTSMGCPAGPLIQQSVEEVAGSIPGIEDVETELTWDPPWTPEKMSDDAKFILGFG